jgi:hypothetical protein
MVANVARSGLMLNVSPTSCCAVRLVHLLPNLLDDHLPNLRDDHRLDRALLDRARLLSNLLVARWFGQ